MTKKCVLLKTWKKLEKRVATLFKIKSTFDYDKIESENPEKKLENLENFKVVIILYKKVHMKDMWYLLYYKFNI